MFASQRLPSFLFLFFPFLLLFFFFFFFERRWSRRFDFWWVLFCTSASVFSLFLRGVPTTMSPFPFIFYTWPRVLLVSLALDRPLLTSTFRMDWSSINGVSRVPWILFFLSLSLSVDRKLAVSIHLPRVKPFKLSVTKEGIYMASNIE